MFLQALVSLDSDDETGAAAPPTATEMAASFGLGEIGSKTSPPPCLPAPTHLVATAALINKAVVL